MQALPEDFQELLENSYEGKQALSLIGRCHCAPCHRKPDPDHLAAHLLAALVEDLVDPESTPEANVARVEFNIDCAVSSLLRVRNVLRNAGPSRVTA